jgi:hypothetical protein
VSKTAHLTGRKNLQDYSAETPGFALFRTPEPERLPGAEQGNISSTGR